MPSGLYFWYKVKVTSTNPEGEAKVQKTPTNYYDSVNYEKGYFDTRVLNAFKVTKDAQGQQTTATIPVVAARYNPQADTGKGNELWCISTFSPHYDKPTTDLDLIYTGQPLWMMLYGFLNYVLMIKKDKSFFDTHYLLMQSTALFPSPQIGAGQYYLPIDQEMVQGKLPYDEYITTTMKARWFPTIRNQIKTLNSLVQCGPYIPKYDQTKNSTWELNFTYQFFLKFGGPEITDPKVVDPQYQQTYDVPDTFEGRLQIKDPAT